MHVTRAAALMKVDNVAIDERKIDLTMQRNATSDEWRRRFREDCGDPNVLHEDALRNAAARRTASSIR